MAMLLKGAEVAKALTEGLHAKTEELKKNGVEPCLAILRVGAREDDLAYERGLDLPDSRYRPYSGPPGRTPAFWPPPSPGCC